LYHWIKNANDYSNAVTNKVLEVDSVYNVNKYATDALNTVLEMISDRPR